MTADPPLHYDPSSRSSRATLFLVIVAVHVLALGLVAAARHVVHVVKTEPLIVKVLSEAPRPEQPPQKVPLPPLVRPEVPIIAPPSVDNLFMMKVQEDKPVTPPPPKPQPVVAKAEPKPPAPVEAPRFDMAYLNNPAPSYPSVSRRAREEGRVLLRVLVNPEGTVDKIEVQQTSGFQRLDDAALDAVRRWRFQPARSGTVAVSGYALVPIAFKLS